MSRPLPNLARITRLRELFLEEQQSKRTIADYWRDARDIEAYDAVLAARIGWKWDAALRECADRGFDRADDQVVLDYGCGSGVAARRFVTHFGAGRLWLHDRSPHAMAFAQESLAATAPSVSSGPLKDVRNANPDVLLVSHVLGELDQAGEDELRALISRSKRVLILGMGAFAVEAMRSALERHAAHVVAPGGYRHGPAAGGADAGWGSGGGAIYQSSRCFLSARGGSWQPKCQR